LDATIGNNNTCDTTDGYNDPDYSGCSRLCDGSDGIRCGCVGATQTFLPGDTVTESCTLNCDVSARGTCFTIGADNLTLDGAGHQITGNATGNGIEATGKNKVALKNLTIENFTNGIYFKNSNNCTIRNCTTNNNMGIGIARGIYLSESNHNTIEESSANANDFMGIYLEKSNNNNITENTANSNGNYGIVLWSHSYNNVVTNNTASQNDRGVTLGYSNTNLISNNSIRDNSAYGIELQQQSNNNTFINNTIVDNGQIGIYSGMHDGYYSFNNIVCNTITNHDCGIYLVNATNTTIEENTITSTTTGIKVEQSAHNNISNNSVNTYSSTGILLYLNSPHNQLLNNTVHGGVSDSGNSGISLDWADHTLLIGNTITNNRGWGISIGGNSKYALVDHNEVSNNKGYSGTGIVITSSWNTITNNTIGGNDVGVSIINYARNLTLSNNTIAHNTEKGIDLWAGEYSTITSNSIINNGEFGIYIFEYSDHNLITANTVCQNGVSDFYLHGSPVGNSGDNNTCYLPDGWNDNGSVGCTYLCEFRQTFDTGAGTYPSISGTHNGTITPNQTITVSKLYTSPCPGTGGHTEYIEITNKSGIIATGRWDGYSGDWHNISFYAPFVLDAGEVYNYTIKTGSYPQIIHAESKDVTGGRVTGEEFVDVDGKRHEGWIPAIRLF
jgi:parallel beta-helix repeat protein